MPKQTTKIQTKNGCPLLDASIIFSSAFKDSPIGMSVTALDGRFLHVNKALCRMLGYSARELTRKKFKDITHPDDVSASIKLSKDLLKDGIRHPHLDKRYIAKSGKIIWVSLVASIIRDKSGGPLYFVAQMLDITDRKEIEERLKDSEQLYRTIVNMSPDAITLTDLKGVIIAASEQTAKLHGYKNTAEIIGKSSFKFIGPNDRDRAVLKMRETLKRGIVKNLEYTMIKKDGSTFIGELSAALVRDAQNNPKAFVGITRDVTKLKEIDRAKTEFVSLASHQLRSPLSAINWYTEMLLNGDAGKLTLKQKEFLSEVYNSNKRMTKLVNDLLNISRIELGSFVIEPEPIDFIKVAESVIHEFQHLIKHKKLKVVTKYDNRPISISADPRLLRIIIENLLSNSIKYTPQNGSISLQITKHIGGNVLVKVSDSGWGIPQKQQNKIFTKLFRADNIRTRDGEGTGLGLYIVKSIVDASGGKIWFESQENKGTTFYVSWPISGMKAREGTKELN